MQRNSSLRMKLKHDHQLLMENISCPQCWRLIFSEKRPDQLFTNGTQQPHSQLWLENGLAGMKTDQPNEIASRSCSTISAAYKCISKIWWSTFLRAIQTCGHSLAFTSTMMSTINSPGTSSLAALSIISMAQMISAVSVLQSLEKFLIESSQNSITSYLIAADVFDSNKKYTVAVVYSPPSEEVSINILNRLHRYNRSLILIGDLNARHFNWHDVTSNSCGHRLAEWIDAKQNLKIFYSAKLTSTRSRAVIDLIIAPSHVSSELSEIDQRMSVTDHYPVHWQISSFSQNRTTQEVKRLDWAVLQCILNLKQNFFFSLAQQMRQESIEFILMYEKFLGALQERCTSYHIVQFYRPSLPVYLVNLIKHRRRVLSSYRCSRSEDDRNLLRSMNSYVHQEFKAVKRAQWQEFCLGLEPKNTHRFWNHCKNLFKNQTSTIQGFQDDETDRVLTDPNSMIEHAHRYYSRAFKERETTSQNQEATEFKRTLSERLAELPAQPFLFKITDLHRSIHRPKTKTSSYQEQIVNDLLLRNTYPEH